MTSQSVLTIVSVRDDVVRHLLAGHLVRLGANIFEGAAHEFANSSTDVSTILLIPDPDIGGDLGDAVADAWAARRWGAVIAVSLDRELITESRRLHAIFSGWDNSGPPPDNPVDASLQTCA